MFRLGNSSYYLSHILGSQIDLYPLVREGENQEKQKNGGRCLAIWSPLLSLQIALLWLDHLLSTNRNKIALCQITVPCPGGMNPFLIWIDSSCKLLFVRFFLGSETHFKVVVVSEKFERQPPIKVGYVLWHSSIVYKVNHLITLSDTYSGSRPNSSVRWGGC